MDFLKKNSKLIGLIGAAVVVIGVFLPFLKVTVSFLGYSASDTVSFIDSWEGKVTLIFGALAGVALFLKKNGLASIPTLLSFVFTIWGVIDGKSEKTYGLGKITCSWGFYIILVGIIAIGVAIFFDYKESKKSLKEYFDFKKEFNQIKEKVAK